MCVEKKKKRNPSNLEYWTHLVHGQVDASVRNDAQSVGQVASVEGPHSLRLQDLSGAVGHTWVLSCLPQRQAGFQHLQSPKKQEQSLNGRCS